MGYGKPETAASMDSYTREKHNIRFWTNLKLNHQSSDEGQYCIELAPAFPFIMFRSSENGQNTTGLLLFTNDTTWSCSAYSCLEAKKILSILKSTSLPGQKTVNLKISRKNPACWLTPDRRFQHVNAMVLFSHPDLLTLKLFVLFLEPTFSYDAYRVSTEFCWFNQKNFTER
jgi:hypothetical protein